MILKNRQTNDRKNNSIVNVAFPCSVQVKLLQFFGALHEWISSIFLTWSAHVN